MKKYLLFVLLSVLSAESFAVAAYDFLFTQRNQFNTGYVPSVPPVPTNCDAVLTYNYTAYVATWLCMGNLTQSSGTMYAPQADWNGVGLNAIANKPTNLVTSSDMSSTLSNYVTSSSLTTQLSGYPTNSAMTTAMSSKIDMPVGGTINQFINGTGSLTTSKTALSQFTNDLNKSSVGLGNVDNTSDASKPISTLTQTALNGKFNAPSGSSANCIKGDGSISACGGAPSGSAGGDLTGSYPNPTLDVTGVIAGSYSGVTVDAKGRATGGTNRVFNYATKTLNSCFQVSSTRDALVIYSAEVTTSLALVGGQQGTLYLETFTDSGCTTGTQEIVRSTNANTSALIVAVGNVSTTTLTVTGVIPSGRYAKLRTQNNTGSPTFTARAGQEVLL